MVHLPFIGLPLRKNFVECSVEARFRSLETPIGSTQINGAVAYPGTAVPR